MKTILISVTIALFTPTLMAQEPVASALTFQMWKEQQVLEAQNQVLRVSARIAQLKGGKAQGGSKGESSPITNSRLKKAELDTLSAAERDLRRAQESLQSAHGLTLSEYATVYLPTLQDQPEAVQAITQKLSREELAEVVKALVSSGKPSSLPIDDAQRSGGLVSESLKPIGPAKSL